MGCPFLVIIFGLYDYKICYNVAVLAATSLHSSMENLLQKQMKVTVVDMLNYLRISTETECEAKAAWIWIYRRDQRGANFPHYNITNIELQFTIHNQPSFTISSETDSAVAHQFPGCEVGWIPELQPPVDDATSGCCLTISILVTISINIYYRSDQWLLSFGHCPPMCPGRRKWIPAFCSHCSNQLWSWWWSGWGRHGSNVWQCSVSWRSGNTNAK